MGGRVVHRVTAVINTDVWHLYLWRKMDRKQVEAMAREEDADDMDDAASVMTWDSDVGR